VSLKIVVTGEESDYIEPNGTYIAPEGITVPKKGKGVRRPLFYAQLS